MRWPKAFSRLRGVRADFISLVDRPAEGGAEIVLTKRDDEVAITNSVVGRSELRSELVKSMPTTGDVHVDAPMGSRSYGGKKTCAGCGCSCKAGAKSCPDCGGKKFKMAKAAPPWAAKGKGGKPKPAPSAKPFGGDKPKPENADQQASDKPMEGGYRTHDEEQETPEDEAAETPEEQAAEQAAGVEKPMKGEGKPDENPDEESPEDDAAEGEEEPGEEDSDEEGEGSEEQDSEENTEDEETRKRVLIDGEEPNKPDMVNGRLSPEEMARQHLISATMQKNNTDNDGMSTVVLSHSSQGDQMSDLDAKIEEADGEVRAYIEALEDRVVAVEESVTKADGEEEDILKSAAPEVVELVKRAQAEAAEATALAKAERETRLRREFLSKAEGMKHLSEEPQQLADLLYEISDRDPELASRVEDVLAKAEAGIASGDLFKSLGSDAAFAPSVEAKIETVAKALREADPALTAEQARARAFTTNPDLYTAYIEEMGA